VEEPPASWRQRLKRWRWWIAAVVLIVAVRVALPIVLRRVIATQASDALHARVEVGDVDLALWKGGVALDDVAVYPIADRGAVVPAAAAAADANPRNEPAAPTEDHPAAADAKPASAEPKPTAGVAEPTSTAAEPTSGAAEPTSGAAEPTSGAVEPTPTFTPPATTAAQPDATPATPAPSGVQLTESGQIPIVAFKRFAVELRYWPLFSKTIQVRDIALDAPRARSIARLGRSQHHGLVPKSDVAVAGATPGGDLARPTATGRARDGESVKNGSTASWCTTGACAFATSPCPAASRSSWGSIRWQCRRSRSAPASMESRRSCMWCSISRAAPSTSPQACRCSSMAIQSPAT
jgi:hypothetical protein